MSMQTESRLPQLNQLFVYGTLAPNQVNDHFLKKIPGYWQNAFIKGKLYPHGIGLTLGFPAVSLNEEGDEIKGQLFHSEKLHTLLNELDDFEGEGYQRVITKVFLEEGKKCDAFVYAYVYVLAPNAITQINTDRNFIDRNFDDLAPRFQRNIYGSLKGQIRLAVLEKDLTEFCPALFLPAQEKALNILDAGGGKAPFSLRFAQSGHQLTLCDISSEMLKLAEQEIALNQLQNKVKCIHGAIQDLPFDENNQYDVVLCHAVIEWVEQPQELIQHLLKCLKAGGILSLTFYNLDGLIFKNLLRTNYKKIIDQDYNGAKGSLTPTYPRQISDVIKWLNDEPLEILCQSGMRVFHDYILNKEHSEKEPETVIALELELSRKMPYRDLGRYVHIVGRKILSGDS